MLLSNAQTRRLDIWHLQNHLSPCLGQHLHSRCCRVLLNVECFSVLYRERVGLVYSDTETQMEDHERAVSRIASRVSSFHRQQLPFRLYHGSTNSTKSRKIDPNRMVDTGALNHVLKIDTTKKTCLVEPNVPMDQLVDATLPYGLVPPVVMEFPGITVGGGFAGTAGESSGFKYGFFENTVNRIEVVLPDGHLVTASSQENPDLFYGAAGSFGTLGVTTLLELRLVPAKQYVELTYQPTENVADALETMKLATELKTNDYVDGILFAPDRGVIVSGRMTDDPLPSTRIQRFSRPHDPWFYIHAERTTRGSPQPVKELTPIRDYLFRYDRGAFWTGKYAFQYFLTPFNRVTRWALDYFMHTRVMYQALHASGHASRYMIQDLLLPYDTAEDFIQYVEDKFNFWPLWLCPFKAERQLSLHPRVKDTSKFVNVGVWGPGPRAHPRFVEVNRQLEQKVRQLGGIKWLYAQAYYTEDEFWAIYDHKWYEGLRQKYRATYLPSVFDKVCAKLVTERKDWSGWLQSLVWSAWPVSGLYGVIETLYEREYLLAK